MIVNSFEFLEFEMLRVCMRKIRTLLKLARMINFSGRFSWRRIK